MLLQVHWSCFTCIWIILHRYQGTMRIRVIGWARDMFKHHSHALNQLIDTVSHPAWIDGFGGLILSQEQEAKRCYCCAWCIPSKTPSPKQWKQCLVKELKELKAFWNFKCFQVCVIQDPRPISTLTISVTPWSKLRRQALAQATDLPVRANEWERKGWI